MEARDIPGYRYLPETNLQDDRNLSQLFAEFYMALIDGEEWSSFKKFQAKIKSRLEKMENIQEACSNGQLGRTPIYEATRILLPTSSSHRAISLPITSPVH